METSTSWTYGWMALFFKYFPTKSPTLSLLLGYLCRLRPFQAKEFVSYPDPRGKNSCNVVKFITKVNRTTTTTHTTMTMELFPNQNGLQFMYIFFEHLQMGEYTLNSLLSRVANKLRSNTRQPIVTGIGAKVRADVKAHHNWASRYLVTHRKCVHCSYGLSSSLFAVEAIIYHLSFKFGHDKDMCSCHATPFSVPFVRPIDFIVGISMFIFRKSLFMSDSLIVKFQIQSISRVAN